MKKSLLLLAVLAGSASAQTGFTVYGIVDLAFTRESSGDTAGSIMRMDSGLLNGSRVGFKGSEDLGNGLSLVFMLENGFAADTGALGSNGVLFSRQVWLGMDGGFGSIRFGRQNTPVYAQSDTFDPFADALAGDSARLFNYSGSRVDNTVSYRYDGTGFRGQVQYGLGEVAGRMLAGFAGYKHDLFHVVLTYTNLGNASGADSARTTLLGGNYNFNVVRAFAAYAWNRGFGALATRDALVGLTAPAGAAGTFMASYIRHYNRAAANADSNQFAIGYLYDLSRRTTLYTSASRLANDGGASLKAFGNGLSDKLLDVGIRHKF